ncbi:MAG: DUF4832 domain-containing protein, partial [Chloroflexota bacterium]|nr:DUF4832 domain-containing protein [Chloroflexota bacterium]
NWPNGGPDAPLDRVLGHLEQLRPVLQTNVDVIAYMELGFIGCWGEMHNSAFGLVEPGGALNSSTYAIIDKAFDVVPQNRMIAVRIPQYKFQYFGSPADDPYPIAPVSASEAFNGTMQSRWGQHEDCLVCGEWNAGTYVTPRQNATEIKTFLNQDNKYVVQGGEPGDANTYNPSGTDEDGDGYTMGQYAACSRVLRDLKQMRWSALSATYNLNNPAAYNQWRAEGCYDTIAKSLGYRFRLTQSALPQAVRPGGTFSMSFTLANEGWASPYNQRLVEVVLRNKVTGQRYRFRLTDDPRHWLPDQASYTVSVRAGIPSSMPVGQYDVLLSLPDPHPGLYERPEYSIRLANQQVWEASTGYNSLLRTVAIDPAASGTTYTGTQFFR